eukprot:5608317-Pleurochrysis_carterae.AAC.1
MKKVTLFVESSKLAELLQNGISECGGRRGGFPSTWYHLGRAETVRFQIMEALLFGKEDCLEEASIKTAHFAVNCMSVAEDGHTRSVARPLYPIELRHFLGVTRELDMEKIGESAAIVACQPWGRWD